MLLQIHDLKIEFPAGPRPLTAVRNIDFEVERGQVLGLVGESGSGKSVTSLAIMRLLPPQASATGEIHFNGVGPQNLLTLESESMRQLRGSKISMIFQEPMTALNPVMRVGDQIAEAVLAHNELAKKEAWSEALPQCDAWLRLDPMSAEARATRVSCLLAAGNKTEARAEFARIEALAPPNLRELQIRRLGGASASMKLK